MYGLGRLGRQQVTHCISQKTGKAKKENQYRGTTKWMQVVNFEVSREVNSFENIRIIKSSNNSLLGEVQ